MDRNASFTLLPGTGDGPSPPLLLRPWLEATPAATVIAQLLGEQPLPPALTAATNDTHTLSGIFRIVASVVEQFPPALLAACWAPGRLALLPLIIRDRAERNPATAFPAHAMDDLAARWAVSTLDWNSTEARVLVRTTETLVAARLPLSDAVYAGVRHWQATWRSSGASSTTPPQHPPFSVLRQWTDQSDAIRRSDYVEILARTTALLMATAPLSRAEAAPLLTVPLVLRDHVPLVAAAPWITPELALEIEATLSADDFPPERTTTERAPLMRPAAVQFLACLTAATPDGTPLPTCWTPVLGRALRSLATMHVLAMTPFCAAAVVTRWAQVVSRGDLQSLVVIIDDQCQARRLSVVGLQAIAPALTVAATRGLLPPAMVTRWLVTATPPLRPVLIASVGDWLPAETQAEADIPAAPPRGIPGWSTPHLVGERPARRIP